MKNPKPLHLEAFTIIESLLMLIALFVFTMVLVAIFVRKDTSTGSVQAPSKVGVEKPEPRSYRFSPKAP